MVSQSAEHPLPECRCSRKAFSAVAHTFGAMESHVQCVRNAVYAHAAIAPAAWGALINDRHAVAKSPGVSASKSSRRSATSYPYAPNRVETTGHFRLKASAILTRVPPPL